MEVISDICSKVRCESFSFLIGKALKIIDIGIGISVYFLSRLELTPTLLFTGPTLVGSYSELVSLCPHADGAPDVPEGSVEAHRLQSAH